MDTMRTKLLYLSGYLILAGLVFGGIFGIALAILLAGLIGTAVGLYRKERPVWKPFALVLSVDAAAIAVFVLLLHHSGM